MARTKQIKKPRGFRGARADIEPSEFVQEEVAKYEKDQKNMNNSGDGALQVPGFGLPLAFEYAYTPFKDTHLPMAAAGNGGVRRLTKREVAMVRFMELITDKPDWSEKVFNEDIVGKWREEAKQLPDKMISDAAFEWCIEELRDRAKYFEENGRQWVAALETASPVVKADGLIPASLNAELRAATQPLLDGKTKDWHPGSNEQVLNLVHPSLYPLVYGETRVLSEGGIVTLEDSLALCGKGTPGATDQPVSPANPSWGSFGGNPMPMWSSRFQWLPAEVKFKGDEGTDVKITSYINNLHPQAHPQLYDIIEKLIGHAIPLWSYVLIYKPFQHWPMRIYVDSVEITPESPFDTIQHVTSEERMQQVKAFLELPENPNPVLSRREPEEMPEVDGEDFWEALEWKWKRVRHVAHPEPDNFQDWKDELQSYKLEPGSLQDRMLLQREFRAKGLQVIVKLASIELTPDKPSYPGGNWHLEGMLNERIVATAIYYYDVSNVTTSRLHFRSQAELDSESLPYGQDDHEPLAEVFGVESLSLRGEKGVQELGSVATSEGRMLVFPNTLHHKVDPFELVDKSKAGHRRFVVLWLVDPNYRILSTANVPPQQKDLCLQALNKSGWGEVLPAELTDMVKGEIEDGLMDLEEAKRLRVELMAERTGFQKTVHHALPSYNFCEH